MKPSAALWLALWGAVLALGFGGASAGSLPGARPTAFVHASVVPMDAERLLADQTLVVSEGRIRAIGPSAKTPVPSGARVVDASGLFLMPGLADMHVHVYAPEELTLYAASGVTTVFNLDGRPAHLEWRRRIAAGELLGPALYSAGPAFNRPRTAAEAVAEVDREAALGYDAIKIYNQVSAAEYPALTAEARRRDLVLVGHIAREPGFEAALSAGQSIAHAEEFAYTFFNDDPSPGNEVVHPLDTMKIPRAVALTKKAGVSVIPTLVAFHNIVRQATGLPAYLRNPDLEYLAPFLRDQLSPERNTYARRFSKDQLPGLAVSYEFQRQLVRALHEGGVPILAGTDASWLGVPGFSLIEEIQNFQDLGFTPYAALRSATADAAKLLRRDEEFGTLQIGRRADILVLRRNPLQDVGNLLAHAGLMVNGRWIPEPERRRAIESLPQTYAASLRRLEGQAAADPSAVDAYLAANDPQGAIGSAVLRNLVTTRGASEVIGTLRRLHEAQPASVLTSEETLNQLGYDLLGRDGKSAVAIFRLNTELYPKSGNAYDSLGEAYLGLGDKERARQSYAKALEVQPDYVNAAAARRLLETELK